MPSQPIQARSSVRRTSISNRRRPLLGSIAALLIATAHARPLPAASESESGAAARLLRFPTLSRDSIAFVYGGDIWTAPRGGGTARQLTTDAGLEWLPRYSPDGKWIAFTGQYDGNRDVYVIPSAGGEPRRLTWWTDIGQPSERQGPNKLEKITENDNTSRDAMWIGDTLYFNSDRDKTFNIFSCDTFGRNVKKLTNYAEYDVRWASAGPGGIVYENGGFLYVLDTATGQNRKVEIRVPSEVLVARTGFVKVADKITDGGLSPEGKRAVFVARGELFTVPAEKGNTRNLTNTSGAHERGAAWSPDGKWIGYVSDQTGEDEIWRVPQDGKGPAERLTSDGHCWRFYPAWSPRSKKIAFAHKNLKLFVLDVASKNLTLADQAKYAEINWYAWSPDSRWIAYYKQDLQQLHQVYLYSLESGKAIRVTSEMNDSHEPVFDPEGKYLYFISDRDLNATIGAFDLSYVYSNPSKVYALTLRKDLPSPFAPESDEVKTDEKHEKAAGGEKKEKDKTTGKDKEEKKEIEPIKIDLEGIEDRIAVFPISPGNYSTPRANKSAVFYLSGPVAHLTGGPDGPAGDLHAFDWEKKKDGVLISGVGGYDLSTDGSKILYAAGEQYGILDAKPGTA